MIQTLIEGRHGHLDSKGTADSSYPWFGLATWKCCSLWTRSRGSINILAAFFGWLALAGFITLPATFTSLQRLQSTQAVQNNAAASTAVRSVQSIPLLVVGLVCVAIGVAGMAWLGSWWRRNYVWLLNRLYMPGILHASVGLLGTVTNIYGQQHGEWNVSATVAFTAELTLLVVSGTLFVLYDYWLLQKVKNEHDNQIGEPPRRRHGRASLPLC